MSTLDNVSDVNKNVLCWYSGPLLNTRNHLWTKRTYPDSKVHRANMRPTWVLSAPDEPHVGPMNLFIRAGNPKANKCCSPIHSYPYLSRVCGNSPGTHLTISRWDSITLYQMDTFSALLAICAANSLVTGEFPAQRPVTRSFGVFFYLCLNKRLSKQWYGWWFETPSRPLWRHCNVGVSTQCHYSELISVVTKPWKQYVANMCVLYKAIAIQTF